MRLVAPRVTDLGKLMVSGRSYERRAHDIVVYKSVGVGLEDVVACPTGLEQGRVAMCGRYDLSDNPAAIAKFKVLLVPQFAPNADLRPTDRAPVVRRAHGSQDREVALLRWGLVPVWAKDLKFGTRCINARAETLASTPAFRVAYRKRRCLVPVNAFFEWTGEPGHKVKWRIGLKDEPLFALAGLWEWWKDPASQQGVETYTIITTDANSLLAPVHDRMPVIIDASDYSRWLDSSADSRDLLAPYPDDAIVIEPA